MKKLLIFPIVIFILVTGVVIYSYITNAVQKTDNNARAVSEENEERGNGNQNLKKLDSESEILQPISSSDPRERSKQIQLIRKNALGSGTIFVGENCTLSPVVTHVESGSPISFFNESSATHTLAVSGRTYSIAPDKRVQIQGLPNVETQLPITCGNSKVLKGYLYTTPSRPTDTPQELDNKE